MESELLRRGQLPPNAYDVDILVFIEYVQSGAQRPAQDSWILWEVV